MDREVKALVRLEPDTSGGDKVLKKLDEIATNTSATNKLIQDSNKSLNDTNTEVKKINTSFKSLVITVTSLVKSIDTLTKYTDTMISSQNVLNQTFGSTVDNLNSYIENLSYMTGIANVDIMKKTSLFGQMATSLGMNAEQASNFAMQLDDLSAKLSLLYNIDFNSSAKALLDAIKGESSTLTTLTGIVVKTNSLQNTLNELGLNMQASSLTGANKALLEYITIAKQVNATNADMGKVVNDVAWQKQILKNQVKELAEALGTLLYPVLKVILPVFNAILIVITTLINLLASFLGITKRTAKTTEDNSNAWISLGNNISGASEKAKKGLRSFDKLNNITTPTPTTSTGGGGGINPQLLQTANNLSKEMLDIRNKAQDIADAIMKWLGFIWDADEKAWKFDHVTLGTILGILIGGGGLIWAITKIISLFKKLTGFGGLGNLLGFGKSSKSSIGLPSFKTLLKGIAELIIVIATITILVEAMGALYENPRFKELMADGLKAFKKLFNGLAEIMIPLIAFSAMITLMGMAGFRTVLQGSGGFIVAIGALTGVLSGLAGLMKINGFEKFINSGITLLVAMFKGLEQIMIPLMAFSALLALMGVAGFVTMAKGCGAFLAVIATLTFVTWALGGWAEDETLRRLINGGLDLLVEFGYGLGKFAGSLIGGLGAGIASGLPEIGTHLANFAENAKPFFEITSGFSSDTALGVKYLAEALLALTEANVLEGVAKFFTFGLTGETSLEKFGEQLEAFAPHYASYAEIVKDVDPDVVKGSADAAKALAELNNKLPKADGKMQEWFGKKDLADWGAKLVVFGEKLKEYSEKVTGLKTGVIQKSVESATALAELNDKLPKTGGFLQLITGNNDIDKWGKKLVTFGKYLKQYSEEVDGLSTDVIENSKNSAMSLVELNNLVPYSGGLASLFTGNNGIDKWGQKLRDFGLYFHDYYIAISQISTSKLNAVTSGVKSLVDISQTIKEKGLTNTLKIFGENLKNSANSFNSYFSTTNASTIGYNFGKALADNLTRGFKAGKFPTLKIANTAGTLTTYKLSAYAEGGFVDSAEMFIARENGLPEMVGRIGNRTAVANNDQIVEAVASGVARANKMTQKDTKVVIEAEGDASGLLNFITFKQKERNRQYGF